MPEILGRIRSAIMPDRPMKNLKATGRELVARGPLKALVEGSSFVWGTNMERVDNIAGTQLHTGGPFK